jgi:CRISPR-associated endonuclease/helicase Cas3
MRYTRLLAKSRRTAGETLERETLAGHLSDVTRMAALLAEQWGGRYLAALGLDGGVHGPRLRMALPRAAFLHDLGKANEHFQRMVRAPGLAPPQAFRHEQLSVWLMLHFEALNAWFFAGCDDAVRRSVLVAVAGHHLRLAGGTALRAATGSGDLRVALFCGHEDFGAALREAARRLDLGAPPVLGDAVLDLMDEEPFEDAMHAWAREGMAWWKAAGAEERRFVALVKALTVAADVAGSAVPRKYHADPAAWSAGVLGRACREADLRRVVAERLKDGVPRPFQEAVAASTARVTFVRAGCGSGKTAAAYLWAERTAVGRKLFFCYPTTGTASQGYADYVPPGVVEAALVHSRSAADLEDLLTNGSDEEQERLMTLLKLDSLVSWHMRITVCTAHTVLGLIQNQRRGLFSFPAIGNGAFVFDEVHQYDARLFGALLRFLEGVRGVPVLLMTASLPRARLAALRETLAQLGEELAVVEGPADLERVKRYHLAQRSEEDAWQAAREAVRDGTRVLWVANTVDRAIARARQAESEGLPMLPYHSRYRYQDRLARHKAVVDAFARDALGGVLAVTTQVCEVSLDLSAELLVTELAPVPALIQRMGRLNRWVTPGEHVRAAPALVIEPPGPAPYQDQTDELEAARRWLALLGEGAISQADLAAAFESVARDEQAAGVVRSAWLDDGVFTSPASLTEESTTIPVLREEDAVGLGRLSRAMRQRAVIRLTLPMPLHEVARDVGGWRREGMALVAPAGRLVYDERFGGRWR